MSLFWVIFSKLVHCLIFEYSSICNWCVNSSSSKHFCDIVQYRGTFPHHTEHHPFQHIYFVIIIRKCTNFTHTSCSIGSIQIIIFFFLLYDIYLIILLQILLVFISVSATEFQPPIHPPKSKSIRRKKEFCCLFFRKGIRNKQAYSFFDTEIQNSFIFTVIDL